MNYPERPGPLNDSFLMNLNFLKMLVVSKVGVTWIVFGAVKMIK